MLQQCQTCAVKLLVLLVLLVSYSASSVIHSHASLRHKEDSEIISSASSNIDKSTAEIFIDNDDVSYADAAAGVEHLAGDDVAQPLPVGDGRRQRRSATAYTYNHDDDYEFSEPVLKSVSHKLVSLSGQSPRPPSIQVSPVVKGDAGKMASANTRAVEGKPPSAPLPPPPPPPPRLPPSSEVHLISPSSRAKLEEAKIKQRIRNRESRKFHIQMAIMQRLGLKGPPQVPRNASQRLSEGDVDRLVEQMQQHTADAEVVMNDHSPNSLDNRFKYSSQWLKRVPPACEQPRGSDVLSWYMRDSFRLYFAVKSEDFFPDYELSNSGETKIASAMLRLYLRPAFLLKSDSECEGLSVPFLRVGKGKDKRGKVTGNTIENELDVNGESIHDRLRVTVFQYRQAVRRDNTPRRDIVDVVYINRRSCGWLKLDMKSAVGRWSRKPKSNHGLEVEVEDPVGSLIDPFDIFQSPNCSSRVGQPGGCGGKQKEGKGGSKTLLSAACMVSNALSSRRPEISVLVIQTPLRAMPQRRRRDTVPAEHCVRDVLEISLTDARIVSPHTVDVGMCRGHCHQHGAEHTACCRPVSVQPLSIIWHSNTTAHNDLTISTVPGLVINQCSLVTSSTLST